MMQCYPAQIEAQRQRYYQSLSEKERRRYAAIEAVKLGYGGQVYIRGLLGCHHETLALGLSELEDEGKLGQKRIRQPGGGRKSALETITGLDEAFLRVLERHTAGSPMEETATTRTGLNVFTKILDKTYHTGRKVTEELKFNMQIVFDDCLPRWNYTAKPESQVI
jgi:hypothetical protein